jgi:hypothetical protein
MTLIGGNFMQSSASANATHPAPGSQSQPPQMILMQMIMGYWVSQLIYVAAKLGIADLLQTGTKHHSELATATGTDAPSLYRLLRALASVGIFTEGAPGQFSTTPLATFLQRDVPGSVRDAAIMMGDREHYNSWGNILHAVQTGQSGFENLFGMDIFAYYAQNPGSAEVFDRAMTSFSSMENAAVCADYDFAGIGSLVDVAGGQGSLLCSILQANPGMTGVLFDQPDVIERAKPQIAASGMGNRVQLASGSFFETVPAGADAYIMKHIIHDWDDERAIAILQNCHRAMGAGGKVLVVEQVIPPGNEPFMGKLLDVNMLVMCPGGKERTAEEFQALFSAAGFELTRIVPTQGIVSVVEGDRR